MFRTSPASFPWGATREEVERLIHQALELHLEGLAEEGLPSRLRPVSPVKSRSIRRRNRRSTTRKYPRQL